MCLYTFIIKLFVYVDYDVVYIILMISIMLFMYVDYNVVYVILIISIMLFILLICVLF